MSSTKIKYFMFSHRTRQGNFEYISFQYVPTCHSGIFLFIYIIWYILVINWLANMCRGYDVPFILIVRKRVNLRAKMIVIIGFFKFISSYNTIFHCFFFPRTPSEISHIVKWFREPHFRTIFPLLSLVCCHSSLKERDFPWVFHTNVKM